MKVLAVTEQRDGALRKVSHEVVGAARVLAGAGGSVDALVLGSAAVQGAESLGANRVLQASHPDFALYSPDGATATIASIGAGYDAIVVAATAMGRDLAPRVAARLGVPCATDCTELSVDGGAVQVTRPIYAGKVLQRGKFAGKAVVSVRPGSFVAASAGTAEVVTVAVPDFTARVTNKGVTKPEAAALDVTEAPVVIAGGRGLKEPANFKLLEDLAAAFGNAAVGASRAVVDAGWRDHGEQVGQTGKTVSPPLYIAVGISGAIQHLAGMRTARTIVAINRDKDAPIFKVADYGIVGDLFEVVPRLTEEVRKLRAH